MAGIGTKVPATPSNYAGSPNEHRAGSSLNTQLELYLERAAKARADADAATLENVRDRCLRSAAAWSEMAAQIERTEHLRFENEAVKAVLISK